ncbi:MAG TPA: phospholipase D-like domain-containing protein [Streptosporangiaceae bacterium]|jgi:phosphatidylserine/phosphatidylglycerophosphate/cardiolipin synthase-like enzyme
MRYRRLLTPAVVLGVALGAAGCQVQFSAGGSPATPAVSSSGSSAAASSAPASPAASPSQAADAAAGAAGTLFTEPGQGFGPVYSLIAAAKTSVDLTMYELSDTTAEKDLAAAAHRGAAVRVILDKREEHTNSAAYSYLKSRGVKVTWSSSAYTYTHQKTLVVNNAEAIILTANLTSRYYSTTRDFGVVDRDARDVAAIVAVFDADFAHHAVTPGDGDDLVWSPTDSQARILSVINGARHSLRVYTEEMADSTMEKALISAAKRGVAVQVVGENTDHEYDTAFAKLAAGGVQIRYYKSPSGFYIHGKVVEADYGTPAARIFIGSENFSSTSLNRNRELGLIIAAPAVLASMARTFAGDFSHGIAWPAH